MSIRSFFRRLINRNNSQATRILGELGCYNRNSNGITPPMCNEGIIREIIRNERRQGNTQTANDLENWLRINSKNIM